MSHEPYCPVTRATQRGEGAVCLCRTPTTADQQETIRTDLLRELYEMLEVATESGVLDEIAARVRGGPDQVNRVCDTVANILRVRTQQGELPPTRG